MIKKSVIVCIIALSLILLASCGKKTKDAGKSEIILHVEEYMSSLSAEKTAHLQPQINLLRHPLKDAIAQYGNDYALSWEGSYAKLTFEDAKCSFEAYVGAAFEPYGWYDRSEDILSCNAMEYLSYAVIERVIFDGEGMTLTDGITIGMSAEQISEKLQVAGIGYRDGNAMITTDYDDNREKINVYHIAGQISGIDYIVVFKENILSYVEAANYNRYGTDADNGKQMIDEAFSFVSENRLANFDAGDLAYQGKIYSPYYGAWFYSWQFTQGAYKGYEVCVEQNAPNRIYAASGTDAMPILFWCDGKYADPKLSFLGKWRDYDRNNYIEVKSVSKEGIVVFDMYTSKADTGEMVLLENLNAAINDVPQTLDAYLLAADMGESLDGDIQLFNGEVQSGYYTYAGDRIYLIDSFLMDFRGAVQYLPTGIGGRVGSGTLPIHIPREHYDYTQASTWGYMENFGRDDPNGDNIVKTNTIGGDAVINDYLNDVHETSGLPYADMDYSYLYDYVFPVNNTTYHVWQSKDAQSPHYLYVDSANGMLIEETQYSLISRHSKELIYKSNTRVDKRSYANQKYVTLDGGIVIDLENRTIHKADAFVPDIEILDVGYDTVGKNARFMFFADIGTRFALNGYILFDQTTWGATLHITDSNIPNFDIGVYYLHSETFFLDPTIGVVGIPEESESDRYVDDKIDEIGKETKLVIRQFSGQIVGYIYVDEQGNKTVKNYQGRILGYYYADRDVTTDLSGKILARGDIASALLFAE